MFDWKWGEPVLGIKNCSQIFNSSNYINGSVFFVERANTGLHEHRREVGGFSKKIFFNFLHIQIEASNKQTVYRNGVCSRGEN